MCDAAPYNITTTNGYNDYMSANPSSIDYNQWLKCLWAEMDKTNIDLSNVNTQIRNWDIDRANDDTATELNNYSMTLYQSDLKYTFSKIIFFIILAIVYIYFFKVNGIIEPIMKIFNFMKTKITVDIPNAADKVIKNAPKVAEKIKENIKVPEIKTS
jgi:hypothetical protein